MSSEILHTPSDLRHSRVVVPSTGSHFEKVNAFVNGDKDMIYENVDFCRQKQTSTESIIYDVPQSNEYIYAQPKSNTSVSVDSLLPQAARLILAQSPKNRSDLIDEDRRDSIPFEDFAETEPNIPSPDYESYSGDFRDISINGYGLEVIHEETESQMSDSDQELDRCTEFCSETLRQRKPFSNDPMYLDEYRERDSNSQISPEPGYSSPQPDMNDSDEKHQNDEIVMKHIRISLDWDPTTLLDRLHTISQPKVLNGKTATDNKSGFMQILSGNRKKGTFWNAWKRKYCVAQQGKLLCYDRNDCKDVFQSVCLIGGKVDFLDPIEFVGTEQGKLMVNRILGIDDGKGHYYVFQCTSVAEATSWIAAIQEEMMSTPAFVSPTLATAMSTFRDIVLVDLGSSNIRAGVLTHQPTLPSLFFQSVISENEETGKTLYGNDVYLPDKRKNTKIRFPFESKSKLCQNTLDMSAVEGFLKKIFSDLHVRPENYRLILTLPRRVDNKCRQNILQLVFDKFLIRSVLICHQTVAAFWAYSVENGIICDVGERCDVVPVSQGFVLSHAWGRAPFGGHSLKHSLRQSLGPQENGLYLSTPTENLVLRFISENFICVGNGNTGRRLSQESQEIIVEMDLGDVLPLSSLIGVDQNVLRGVAEGFFDPGFYGLDCDGLPKIIHKSLQDCGVDIRKEMSQNIYLVGGCTQIPGFTDRLQTELLKLCPPHLKPKILASPYRYHATFIGASILAGTEAYEMSLLQRVKYEGGPGPAHWLI